MTKLHYNSLISRKRKHSRDLRQHLIKTDKTQNKENKRYSRAGRTGWAVLLRFLAESLDRLEWDSTVACQPHPRVALRCCALPARLLHDFRIILLELGTKTRIEKLDNRRFCNRDRDQETINLESFK